MTVKEKIKKCNYRERSSWTDTAGCSNCSRNNTNNGECNYHGFSAYYDYTCDDYKEK